VKKNSVQQKMPLPEILKLVLLASLGFIPMQLVIAEESLCKVRPASVFNQNTFSSDGKTHLQSDNVEFNEKDISRFNGNVVIQQKDKRIETDQAEYKKQTEEVTAKGRVRFISSKIQIESESAHFNLKTDQANLKNAKYQSTNNRAHGTASKIEVINKDITKLTDATFTTCDADNIDWIFNASTLKFDNKARQGSASNVIIRFKGVPFFYFPYLRFPLGEDRLSGFLFPYIGSSSRNGNELKLPYYWNIHPQLDATITPWYMSKRGTLLHTEFRYLTENNTGSFTAEYLNNDKVFNNSRKRWKWLHQSKPGLGWQSKIEYNYVADAQHLFDFTSNIKGTSTTYLIRSGDISYNIPNWLLNIKAEAHQILSGTEPYKRLPQITLNSRYAVKNNALNYNLQTEAVRFEHVNNKVIGDRLHIKSSISYPLVAAAGFFKPGLSVQYTNYNLRQTTGATQISRSVPSFSLDSGLFFERDTKILGSRYIQTLEPQLFYVYVPYKDQSALPIFDTSAYAFNVNQSFADYRFNGIDRIGDDNRLTTALATRFINQESGKETFMARIGQIQYFSDRKVQLLSTAVDRRSRSNIIAEIKTQASNWNLFSQLEWDPELKEKVTSSNQLSYQYENFKINLAQRFQRNSLKTREVKINWKLNSRWQFDASHLYDIRNEHIVQSLFAVNYESCCWSVKLSTNERFLTANTSDRGIYITLTLKGLGGVNLRRNYTSNK